MVFALIFVTHLVFRVGQTKFSFSRFFFSALLLSSSRSDRFVIVSAAVLDALKKQNKKTNGDQFQTFVSVPSDARRAAPELHDR